MEVRLLVNVHSAKDTHYHLNIGTS